MSYFILMGRRIPKQAITGFKFQNETDNIRPFLSIRIRGKDEIIPFKDKKEIQSVKAHLCSIFSGFVKIGDWYLKMSEVKEYKPVTAEDMNPYILFKTSNNDLIGIFERYKDIADGDMEVAMNFIKEAYPFNEETESFIRKKFDMPIPDESKEP